MDDPRAYLINDPGGNGTVCSEFYALIVVHSTGDESPFGIEGVGPAITSWRDLAEQMLKKFEPVVAATGKRLELRRYVAEP